MEFISSLSTFTVILIVLAIVLTAMAMIFELTMIFSDWLIKRENRHIQHARDKHDKERFYR